MSQVTSKSKDYSRRGHWIRLGIAALVAGLVGASIDIPYAYFTSTEGAYDAGLAIARMPTEALIMALFASLGWLAVRTWSPRAQGLTGTACLICIVLFGAFVATTPPAERFHVPGNLLMYFFRHLPELVMAACILALIHRKLEAKGVAG